jgi:predicted membrane-bound dolichyl-phosphate-mannose-protein mannosyltransferase
MAEPMTVERAAGRDRPTPTLAPKTRTWGRSAPLLLSLILLVSGGAIVLAMRRTSTTFDEPVMITGGARGYQTGAWNIAPEHPPLTQYLYGLLPYLAGARYPDEAGVTAALQQHMGYRYHYAAVFFGSGINDPERMAFLGRLPAAVCALLLAALAFAFTRRHYGDGAGLLAATLVAFLPDVLAHGGVAYNDVPIALAYFLALWRVDEAIRRPGLALAVGAGLALGIALGVKNSAVGLAPTAVLLLSAEAALRRADRAWRRGVAQAAVAAAVTAYLTLVVIYRGDLTLAEYRYALSFTLRQVPETNASSYLLGRVSTEGFWYYFPVAFLYKTSAGFHALLAVALLYFGSRCTSVLQVLRSPLRGPAIGALVFGTLLMRSHLNIGFRHALPLLPLVAVITAVGAARVWQADWRRARAAIALATAWLVVHPLSYFPNFLTYVSEYGPGRDRNYEVFADSSLDWGQGLLLLREFMREHDLPRVYLSYFGSAWPGGYGIAYAPLVSFFRLPPPAPGPREAEPRWVVISATNLTGAYLPGDPFRGFREQRPAYVLGHALYVYEVQP